MRQPDQKMRFSDVELGQIKGLFAENDDLLFALRKAMLQFELTEADKEKLAPLVGDVNYALLYKTFLPYIDPEAPLFQMTDMVLGLNQDIAKIDPETAWPYIKAKEIEIAYISQQLKNLHTPSKPAIILTELADLNGGKKDKEQIFINVTARNYILSFIDSNIAQLKFLAGLKSESVEEAKARLEKNSTK